MEISCSCGAGSAPGVFFSKDTASFSRPCSNSGLKNHRSFVPFVDIPDDELNEEYHYYDGTAYVQSRHWCLIGEIVNVHASVCRSVTFKTRFGEYVPVYFFSLSCDSPEFFDWSDLKIGSTMGILYPYSHRVTDGIVGIMQGDTETVMVFPSSLDSLTKEVDIVAAHSANSCDLCGKGGSSQCGRCKGACYCSKECQLAHWSQGHKKLCKHWSLLQKLVAVDFTSVKGSYDWTFVLKPLLSLQQRKASVDRRMQEIFDTIYPGQSLQQRQTSVGRRMQEIGDKVCPGQSLGRANSFAPGPILCTSCSRVKKRSEYSNSQLKKKESCCTQCIAGA